MRRGRDERGSALVEFCWVGLVLFIPTSTLLAPMGARLAHSLSKRRLEVAFGVFLLLVSLRFAASLLA